jgi:hypothetical protein
LVFTLYEDPEIDDKYLVVYVRLKKGEYTEDLIDKLSNAESEFLNDLAGRDGWIQLTTDFQEPED